MDDNIQNYRQPMVTSIGIIMGFILGFSGKLATDPAKETEFADYIVIFGLLIGIVLMMTALYRILNNSYPKENTGRYYKKTLRILIFGISSAFLGVLISILQSLIKH